MNLDCVGEKEKPSMRKLNIQHSKRSLVFLTTLDKGDELLSRRFAKERFGFSLKWLVATLSGTTFPQRQRLGAQLERRLTQRADLVRLLVRSMTRWVLRAHPKNSHSPEASLQIIGGAPASGKSHLSSTISEDDVVTYDSDADKLRLLYLLSMVPSTFETEVALGTFLAPIKIGWIGDLLQPLQRTLRTGIFQQLAELCYHVRILGLHTTVASIQNTSDAFPHYPRRSVHLVDISGCPELQARRLKAREEEASHFAVLPWAYARNAAVEIHEMTKSRQLRRVATRIGAEVLLTTLDASDGSGRCRMTTKVLVEKMANVAALPQHAERCSFTLSARGHTLPNAAAASRRQRRRTSSLSARPRVGSVSLPAIRTANLPETLKLR